MAETGKGRLWLRYGCFGCLGIIGIVLLVVGTTLLIAYLGVRGEEIVEGPSEAPEAVALNESRPSGSGTINLDLRHAEFVVRAAKPGQSVGVEARYDRKRYELIEQFTTSENGGWVYDVSFSGSGNGLITLAQQLLGGSKPKVWVHVPTDAPVDLKVTTGNGELTLELDDMWLTDATVELSWGAVLVSCSEPLEHPVGSLELSIDMGGMEASGLGNASPARLLVEANKGGGMLDLRGAWARDGDIGITGKSAGIAIKLPGDIRVERDGGPEPLPQSIEKPIPTLRINSTIEQGNIEYIN